MSYLPDGIATTDDSDDAPEVSDDVRDALDEPFPATSALEPSIKADVLESTQREEILLDDEWRDNDRANANAKANRNYINLVRGALWLDGSRWLEYFGYTLLALVIQFACGWGAFFPDGTEPEGSTTFACNYTAGGSSTRNADMCDLSFALNRGAAQFRVLVAFILGGYVGNTVLMWRTRRTAYAALCGATRNLILQIGTLVDPGPARTTMKRWAVLGFELSVLKGRGLIDTDVGKMHLEGLGLVAEGEWAAMLPGDRHTTVWFWVQKKAVRGLKEGYVKSDTNLLLVSNAVTLIRDRGNDLMAVIGLDQPMPYSAVTATLVNLNLLVVALARGIEWAILFYETDGSCWLTPRMYADVLINLMYNTIFAILFDLSNFLYNPFGPRDGIDIPHREVGAGLRNLAKELSRREDPPTMDLQSHEAMEPSIRVECDVDFAKEIRSEEPPRLNNAGILSKRLLLQRQHTSRSRMSARPVLSSRRFDLFSSIQSKKNKSGRVTIAV